MSKDQRPNPSAGLNLIVMSRVFANCFADPRHVTFNRLGGSARQPGSRMRMHNTYL
jgi:hypothetical protein